MCFFLDTRRPPRSTRPDTRFPYTALFRSVATLRGFLSDESRWAAAEAAQMNRGLARLNAERLGLRMQTVDCLGGPALRCRHVAAEPAAGTSRSAPSNARRMAGLIFADFTSFRRLRDPIFPSYSRDLIPTLATLHAPHAPHMPAQQ